MYGYDSDSQREAQDWIDGESDPTETPPAWVVKAFEANDGFPYTGDRYRVREAEWAEGQPRHGEMRSDDHTSKWVTEGNLTQMHTKDADGEEPPDACPECRHRRGIYKYDTHHHIAGRAVVICARCEEVVWESSWG